MSARRNLITRAAIPAAIVLAALAFLVFWTHSRRSATTNGELGPESADFLRGEIYPDGARAPADLANALAEANRENKRILIDFGGNWCGDCHVLDLYLHTPPNLALLNANYVLVQINIGNYDENLDLAARYGVPLEKGVPALAVLAPDGQLLYSQRDGQFEAMRNMNPASVTNFLNKWKS